MTQIFYSPWHATPPFYGVTLPVHWESDWFYDGYAEEPITSSLAATVERAAADAPAYGTGRKLEIGPGVYHPRIGGSYLSNFICHYRNLVSTTQGGDESFDYGLLAGVYRAPVPVDYPPEIDLPGVVAAYWQYEGYEPLNFPRYTGWAVEYVLEALTIGKAEGLYAEYIEGTTVRLRWLPEGDLFYVPNPLGNPYDDLDVTARPFPSGGRPHFHEQAIEAPPDSSFAQVVLDPPLRFSPPVGAKQVFGVEFSTSHVDTKAAAHKYSQVAVRGDWHYRVDWPRHRYIWEVDRIPPLRQRQRGDGLVIGDQRQYVRGNSKSLQASVRQLWSGSFL